MMDAIFLWWIYEKKEGRWLAALLLKFQKRRKYLITALPCSWCKPDLWTGGILSTHLTLSNEPFFSTTPSSFLYITFPLPLINNRSFPIYILSNLHPSPPPLFSLLPYFFKLFCLLLLFLLYSPTLPRMTFSSNFIWKVLFQRLGITLLLPNLWSSVYSSFSRPQSSAMLNIGNIRGSPHSSWKSVTMLLQMRPTSKWSSAANEA